LAGIYRIQIQIVQNQWFYITNVGDIKKLVFGQYAWQSKSYHCDYCCLLFTHFKVIDQTVHNALNKL